jgi:hypothetical protein
MSMFKVKPTAQSFKPSNRMIRDIPVVFLSFDEPNADHHWELLQKVVPHSNIARVHGVKGFDACHKAAGNAFPWSDYVITVDADNQIDPEFFNKTAPQQITLGMTFTWGGRQFTNGLMYGNGGLKMWNRDHLLNMRSHEASDNERDAVDFCWDFQQYKEVPGCYSTVYTNGSPYQAFRVGFREGVKLSMEQGQVIDPERISKDMHAANFQRLLTWMTVGRDVEHGAWSMYGARLAAKMLYFDDFDFTLIRDYDWFIDFFEQHKNKEIITELTTLSVKLQDVYGFRLPGFTADESRMLKMLQLHPEKPLTYEDVRWRTNLGMFGWFK